MYTKEMTPIPPTVQKGDKGAAVKRAQEWLCFHGHNVKIDGASPGGSFGAATASAVQEFQAEKGLAASGVVDAAVWGALLAPLVDACAFRPTSTVLGDAVLEVAQAHLSPHPIEIGGDNRGPWVRHYCRGLEGDQIFWCQGFASSIVDQATEALNIASPIPLIDQPTKIFSLFVPWVVGSARQAGRLASGSVASQARNITAGSFFFVRGGPHGWSHVGIVKSVDLAAGVFTTIEGNANHQGSNNGIEVCAFSRKIAACDFGIL